MEIHYRHLYEKAGILGTIRLDKNPLILCSFSKVAEKILHLKTRVFHRLQSYPTGHDFTKTHRRGHQLGEVAKGFTVKLNQGKTSTMFLVDVQRAYARI